MPTSHPSVTPAYRVAMAIATPFVRWWGRLEVRGAESIPPTGALVVLANHDSTWDPLVIGVAARGRQIRALAKASLWKRRPLAWLLDGMGQIPIERGRADLAALAAATEQLQLGNCVGVFPEGTISRGQALRPLSGAGRLVLSVPGTTVICAAVTGAVDLARFPHRPRIRVEFYPLPGGVQPDESALSLTRRAMSDIRARAPHVAAGRKPADNKESA